MTCWSKPSFVAQMCLGWEQKTEILDCSLIGQNWHAGKPCKYKQREERTKQANAPITSVFTTERHFWGLILASVVGYYRLLMLRCIQPAVEAGTIQKQPVLCAASVGRGQIMFSLWTSCTRIRRQRFHPSLGPPTQTHLITWGKHARSGQFNLRRQLFLVVATKKFAARF